MRTAINAAIIQNRRLLLVRKKDHWILPGGKPEPNESDLECLCREVKEELSGTQLERINYYGTFDGKTPHTGDILLARVYFADIKGELISTSAEIVDYAWARDISKYNLSDITAKIMFALKKEEYL